MSGLIFLVFISISLSMLIREELWIIKIKKHMTKQIFELLENCDKVPNYDNIQYITTKQKEK